ncbi:SMI1 / KNR4 family [Pannonibacter phragmitetus]|uniref:SMI1 / KNR4 family n=1 Tax=Pannonibacter phragmitetus TaxID=121719 RepID=A0A379HK52_9HYPH|nr:SMI1/KNR4 family protein [Pannonibacter phragmitetus]SUC82800.1 SMI1 / KNR4 family [Pannonibacter phragmitetus]
MGMERENFEQLCRAGIISGPVDDLVIEQAESELGVQFPSEYRELLREYGAVLADGIHVYGLPKAEENDPPQWEDVVVVTKQLREWGQVGTDRQSFIPICDDGSGVYFYLDTSASPATKIHAIGPGVEQAYGAGLFRFLLDLSAGKIVI